MKGTKSCLRIFAGLFLASDLALLGGGCLGPLVGGGDPPVPEAPLPDDWREIVADGVRAKYPDEAPKILFLAPPRPGRVRYRYWTEMRLTGFCGVAALKARVERGKILGPDGPWFVVYVLGPEGVELLTDNLEATDVDPPFYALEVVDVSKGSEIRLPRPLGLSRADWRRVGEFSRTPWETLPDWQ